MSTESEEDDNFGTEEARMAILRGLGEETRNRVLAGLFMGRYVGGEGRGGREGGEGGREGGRERKRAGEGEGEGEGEGRKREEGGRRERECW